MKLNEHTQLKLTIFSLKDWGSFQAALQLLQRRRGLPDFAGYVDGSD